MSRRHGGLHHRHSCGLSYQPPPACKARYGGHKPTIHAESRWILHTIAAPSNATCPQGGGVDAYQQGRRTPASSSGGLGDLSCLPTAASASLCAPGIRFVLIKLSTGNLKWIPRSWLVKSSRSVNVNADRGVREAFSMQRGNMGDVKASEPSQRPARNWPSEEVGLSRPTNR